MNDSDNFMGLLFHKNFIFCKRRRNNHFWQILPSKKKSYTSILFPLNIDSKYHSFGTSLQSKKKTLKNRQIDHMPNEPWEFFFKKIGSICFEEGPG